MSHSIAFKSGELLYRNFYIAYKPLYFLYKQISEKNEINLLKKHIQQANVIIDIGANIGFYSILFSNLVGVNGTVYAFEPDKKNYENLIKNIHSIKNIITENKAVSNQSGYLNLYKSELNVDHRTYPTDNSTLSEKIECISMDEYFKATRPIDLIKMDIQGYEPIALEGMKNTIQKNLQLKLFSEFWPYGLQKSGYSAEHYFKQLKNLFSNIFLLADNQLIELNESLIKSLENSPNKYYNIFAQNV